MADEKNDAPEQVEESKASGGSGKLVTILVVLNTLLILAGGGYFMFIKKDPPPQIINKDNTKEKEIKKEKKEDEDEGDTKEFGESHEYKGIIVNLNEPGGSRMLKVSIAFEFKAKKKKLKDALTKREVQIRSAIIMYLSGLSYIQTTGSANKELILKTIKKKVNAILTEGKIRKVFFKEFVVQ